MSSFMGELVGTMLLILLGDGVVANVVLNKTKGQSSGWIVITTGWAIAVAVPAFIFGTISGAHFNPALTIALAAIGKFPAAEVFSYIVAQMIGAIIGAFLVYLMYCDHFDATEDPNSKLGVFCTAPAIKNTFINFMTEVIGTFVLVFGILGFGLQKAADGVGTLYVGLLILVIGVSLGGPTGYAINPARDLGPRIAHAILPIKGKRDADWGYAWVPVVGPIVGGLIAAFLFVALF
ncbi:MIP/aquaporin family protein [Clostridium rectalis]|uniref:MIP/aquaporin family protein n=1 Tax=Clostridium rectalis TaxID=2040295 RepID=UPI000F632C01|nr:MIP/aquaporin family protein [Clostridium rectalis]